MRTLTFISWQTDFDFDREFWRRADVASNLVKPESDISID